MNTEFQVTDPVKVYHPDPKSEFFLIGRIVYIDTHQNTDRKEYGVLYYPRHSNDVDLIHAAESQLRKMPIENPPSCPSNSFTNDYIDEIVRKENKTNEDGDFI